jgi:signal transduction histidine kinase
MYWYSTFLNLLLLFAAATSTLIALFAWKRRPVPGATAFAVTMLAVAQWSLAYMAQMVSDDLADKLVWATSQYIGLLILPVAWLIFAFHYIGQPQKLTRQAYLILAFVPSVSFLLLLTNEAHNLFWQSASLQTANGLTMLQMTPGFWYWVNATFLYACYLVGSLLLLTSERYEIASLSHRQALVLLIGLLLPWFGLAMQLAGLSAISLMPLAFAISGIMVARYVLRFRFVKRTPLANHAAINSLGDGVLAIDGQMNIADANAAAAGILQRPLSQLLDRPLATIWPELSTQYPYIAEQPLDIAYKGSDSIHFYEVSLTPLLDWRRQTSINLLLLHDITQRKQLEHMREDITHSLVHDLRSPISNSLFALQMLKSNLAQDAASADNHDLVDMTFANTEKALGLVNNILDVARLENDQMVVNHAPVHLDKLAAQVIRGHLAHAQEKQIHLYHQIPPDLPPAWADAKLLERILQNLVDNSLKFASVGGVVGVTAKLAADTSSPHAPRLEVSVCDNGPGIAPELTNAAFDKFVVGNCKESGSGLGLAFCQMALAAHGEKIWVQNNPSGPGVTFTFSLTAVPARDQSPEIETAVVPHPAPPVNRAATYINHKQGKMVATWH